jgi:hypothetical protein
VVVLGLGELVLGLQSLALMPPEISERQRVHLTDSAVHDGKQSTASEKAHGEEGNPQSSVPPHSLTSNDTPRKSSVEEEKEKKLLREKSRQSRYSPSEMLRLAKQRSGVARGNRLRTSSAEGSALVEWSVHTSRMLRIPSINCDKAVLTIAD